MKNKKKGFTIVELVIVIAVIAILAAVLIPTFTSLIGKANLASDSSIIKNINTQLAIAEVDDGKNLTMYDALQDAKEAGFLVSNINARSDNQLVWDETIDRFALIDKDGNVIAGEKKATNNVNLWKISKNVETKYSTYYIGTAKEITTDKGFDAGEVEGIETINYSHSGTAQNVVIRTNGGALKVNAEHDTVKHYGKADSIDIEKVASTSYREYGEVGYAKIANGRLVVEETSKIDGIYLVANSSGEFDGIKLAVVGKAELPTIARAEVSLNDGQSKLVVEIQTLTTSESVDSNPEYIWISKTGAEVSTNVSSSSTDSTATVQSPSAAATVTKEDTEEAANPIDNNSQARLMLLVMHH